MLRSARSRVAKLAGASWLLGALLLSCSGDTASTSPRDSVPALPAAVASLTVVGVPADGLLLVGQPQPLAVDVRDAAGAVLVGRSVVWSTSNAVVATVSTLGVVTAAATGVVTVTAVVEGHSGAASLVAHFAITTPIAGASQAMTTSILGGRVSVTVPPNAIPPGSVLNVAPADTADLPAGSRLMPNSAFVFGPAGTQFATPISLSVQVDTSRLASWERAGLAIGLLENGTWKDVPGSTVSGDRVMAPVSHFSTYGVLRPLPPTIMTIVTGNGQTATASTSVAISPAVKVLDASGRGVSSVPVQFILTGGGGSLTGGSQLTDESGTATAGVWTLGGAAGPNSLVAASAGLSPVTFTATAAPAVAADRRPVALVVVSQPDIVQSGVTFPTPVVVDVIDSLGRVQGSSLPVTLSVDRGNGTLAGTMTVAAVAGRATFADVRMTGPSEQNVILVSAPGLPPNAVRVTVTPAGLSKLLRLREPLQGVGAYAPYPSQPVVEIIDAAGRRIAGATNQVFVTDFGDPGSLRGTRAVQAVDGVATFTNLATEGAGIHRLYFTADDQSIAPVLSEFFHVATNLYVMTSPSSPTRSGALLSPQPVVMLSDYGNFAFLLTPSPGITAYVTASIGQDPRIVLPYPGTRAGALSGTTTVRAVNGIATFTDLRVSGLGPVRIDFSLSPRFVNTFSDLFVSPAVAQVPARIVILAQPTAVTSGQKFLGIGVEVRDATGALILGDVHPVTVAIASGNGTLRGTTTEVTSEYGSAYYQNFAIAGSGPHTLVYSTGGVSVKGAPISVIQVPRTLAITTQPAGTVSGAVLPTQPVVKILDDAGLPVMGANTPVTVSVADRVPVTLSGPTTVNAIDGVATFSGLKVAGGREFDLQFSTGGLRAQSQTLQLSQVAARLRVVAQLTQVISGLHPYGPTVEVLDADGERVALASSSVTATLNSGPGISLIGGTSTAPDLGLASFPSLILTGAGTFRLDFGYPGVPGVSSNSLVLTQLVKEVAFSTPPAGAVDGAPFTTQPIAEVRDHANLLYAVNSGTATVSVISGPGTLGGTRTVSIVNGIARFTDLKLSGKGAYVLELTTSLPLFGTPGPLTRSSITVP